MNGYSVSDTDEVLKNTMPYNRRRLISLGILIVGAALVIAIGVKLLLNRNYNLVSVMIALFSCVPFYIAYEKREGSVRRMVLLAVLVAIAVVGRAIFAAIPYFKPVTAVVILSGIYMGPESGFLVGSLSAIVSNIFFGQGPWTPFQMFSWGIIGLIAGLPGLRKLLRKRIPLAIYGLISGVLYSCIMDIWTVFSLDGRFSWSRYAAAIGTAVPVFITYSIANVVFLMLTIKPVGEKLNRIQIKHGIF